MVRKYIAFSWLLAATVSIPSMAQTAGEPYEELGRFQEEAGKLSILYRGKRAEKYNFAYNGNYFWDSPAFQTGDISYNGKLYRNVKLNIDASRQIPMAYFGESMVDIALVPERVEWLSMGDRRFDNLRLAGVPEAEEGFFELLYDGRNKFYRRVNKYKKVSTSSVNGDAIGYDDPKYRDEVLTYFAINVRYFLLTEDRVLVQVKGKSTISRAFPGHKKELKKIDSDGLADYCINALEYLEK